MLAFCAKKFVREVDPHMLDVIFGQVSDPGKVRTNNEDAMGSFVPRSRQEARALGWMFVVADGVGGMDLGEVASAKAVQVMTEGFAHAQDGTSLLSLLPRLVQHANAAVHDEGLQPERRGRRMATTVVSCALRHDQAYIAHVGDSRCYHVRDREATVVTRDHTWVNEQRKLGLISAAEAAGSESRHVLTRALGPELFVTADTATLALRAGDILVLCSDGLYGSLKNDDIARIVSQKKDVEVLAQELVRYAVEVDGSDNATAQVIAVRSIEPMAMYRGRLYPLPGGSQ
ncbi:MAG TPA: protein phosphatase 2C domain-containing protein [Acidobacteriaceae bacterium]|nr:protein phosphatase 2C domain-containing protein [Acidobacteriaceae bacterium]